MVEVGRVERIFVDEGGVLAAGADVAQREDLFGGAVEPVDDDGRDAVLSEQLAHRFARGDLAGFEAVVVGRDVVDDVFGHFLLSDGRVRLRRGRVAADSDPQQGR